MWATVSDLFSSSDKEVVQRHHHTGQTSAWKKRMEQKNRKASTWQSVVDDLRSCGRRPAGDDEDDTPKKRPPVPQKHAGPVDFTPPEFKEPAKLTRENLLQAQRGVSDVTDDSKSMCGSVYEDVSELGSPEPPRELPADLVSKIGKMMKKEDAYILREIGERAMTCNRFAFLKQCLVGNEERCRELWFDLEESDRRDFYQACRYGSSKARDKFYLLITEPDAHSWRGSKADRIDSLDCGSTTATDVEVESAVDEFRSESPPGTCESLPSRYDQASEPIIPLSATSLTSTDSFSVQPSLPRRRYAKRSESVLK